jgi:hypothetical protein
MFEGTTIKRFEGATCARLRAERGPFLRDHRNFGAGLDREARRDRRRATSNVPIW